MKEIWNTIPKFSEYQVSNLGKVKHNNKILKGRSNGKYGYLFVTLYEEGTRTRAYIHHLVTSLFIGICPKGYQRDHINRDTSNNRVDNLRYCTVREQNKFKAESGVLKGERNGQAKLTRGQVIQIRQARDVGKTLSEIAVLFSISFQHVSDIIHRKRWGWLN